MDWTKRDVFNGNRLEARALRKTLRLLTGQNPEGGVDPITRVHKFKSGNMPNATRKTTSYMRRALS